MRGSKKEKILITGGAGFIGSHLAAELNRCGYEVRILDCFASQVHGSSQELPEHFPAKSEVIQGDVRNTQDIRNALEGVDAVYHFAASVGVGQSMYEIDHYVENNNGGTAKLLQVLTQEIRKDADRKPIRKLIIASSMSLYGEGLYSTRSGELHSRARRSQEQLRKHEWELKSENGELLHPLPTPETKQPDLASIYALTKFDQEQMCLIAGQTYGIPTTALRFFNVYGRGQALSNPYTGVMAIFASRLLNRKPPLVFEDGNQRRDFVHVSDVARACRLALENDETNGEVFNIGTGTSVSVREIATQMAEALGTPEIEPEITGRYRAGDIRHCFSDISKARRLFGYQPLIGLDTGIRDLTQWLKEQKAADRSADAQKELIERGLAA